MGSVVCGMHTCLLLMFISPHASLLKACALAALSNNKNPLRQADFRVGVFRPALFYCCKNSPSGIQMSLQVGTVLSKESLNFIG